MNDVKSTKSELIKQFQQKLEMVLDKQFPKAQCKERGQALVLWAQAVILFEKCFDAFAKDTFNEPRFTKLVAKKLKEIKEEYPHWKIPSEQELYIFSIKQTREILKDYLEDAKNETGETK